MMEGFIAGTKAAGKLEGWAARQVYIAGGQMMAAAAVLGIDTCPLEGLDPAKYDELLGLTGTGYATLFAIAAGYRAAEDKYAAAPKVRFAATEIIARR
jgi:nitroreductase